jgi:hypothetical protein
MKMSDYRWGMFGLLTLISVINVFTLVLVFAHRIHGFHDFRVMSLFTMGLAIVAAWSVNLRECRRVLPASDAALYKKLAYTISGLGLFVNLCVQAGTGLLMYR